MTKAKLDQELLQLRTRFAKNPRMKLEFLAQLSALLMVHNVAVSEELLAHVDFGLVGDLHKGNVADPVQESVPTAVKVNGPVQEAPPTVNYVAGPPVQNVAHYDFAVNGPIEEAPAVVSFVAGPPVKNVTRFDVAASDPTQKAAPPVQTKQARSKA